MKIYLLLFGLLITGCDHTETGQELPACVSEKIQSIESGDVWNPPAKIYQFVYHNETVYYITPRCCDIPSILMDSECNTICNPDGGITGTGDGKCPDLPDSNTWKLVWEDRR